MQEELNNLSAKVSDLDFSLTIITSLPESWDHFTSALLASKESNLELKFTSTELVSILLKEEQRQTQCENDIATQICDNQYHHDNNRSSWTHSHETPNNMTIIDNMTITIDIIEMIETVKIVESKGTQRMTAGLEVEDTESSEFRLFCVEEQSWLYR